MSLNQRNWERLCRLNEEVQGQINHDFFALDLVHSLVRKIDVDGIRDGKLTNALKMFEGSFTRLIGENEPTREQYEIYWSAKVDFYFRMWAENMPAALHGQKECEKRCQRCGSILSFRTIHEERQHDQHMMYACVSCGEWHYFPYKEFNQDNHHCVRIEE